ncbi:uncharacterized protein TrAFT101_004697 [Trichoderma asperellum]|nr:hypothetical protein TrAFT101_004697 [Trichoderma asperellum]
MTMENTDEHLPPMYEAEDQIMLLPPPYHGRDDCPAARSDGVIRVNNILPASGKASGTMSRYWKWIAKEVASSTERHGKNSDMCFGACCRG